MLLSATVDHAPVRDHLDRARPIPILCPRQSAHVLMLRVAGALEGDGQNVAVGSGAVHLFTILPDHGVKRWVSGLDAHARLDEVVVNRLCADSLQISTQPSDGGNPSAQNSAKKQNENLELILCTPVHNMHSHVVFVWEMTPVEIII